MAIKTSINGMYENGTIHFPRMVIRLGRKLPVRNRARLHFILELPNTSDPVLATRGLIRVPKRWARLIAESPEFSILNT